MHTIVDRPSSWKKNLKLSLSPLGTELLDFNHPRPLNKDRVFQFQRMLSLNVGFRKSPNPEPQSDFFFCCCPSSINSPIQRVMGSFKLQFCQLGLQQKPRIHTLRISCGGLRNGPRKPMWRTRVLSTEAIHAVQSLKLAQNSPSKLEQVFTTKLSRLLKVDLEDTLAELQRQNELDLALKVFNFVRKETWYVPDLSLFNDMILMVGKYKKIEMVEQLFLELRNEDLEPDARTYTELIGAYFKVGMVNKAMETYELMKASGYTPDKLTLTILIRNLEKAGEDALSETIEKECAEYFDYPDKFLEEVARKHLKRKKLVIT